MNTIFDQFPKSDSELDFLLGLTKLLSDPAAAKQRIAEFKAASTKAREDLAAADASRSALAEAKKTHDALLASEKAAHSDFMDRARRNFESERTQALDKIRYQASATARLHDQAKTAADEAERLKSQLCEKIAKIQQAAA
jgi:hypothetical protein